MTLLETFKHISSKNADYGEAEAYLTFEPVSYTHLDVYKKQAMSRKKQDYEKITALYCRISLDDGGDNESMSISNQKIMLRDFAEKHGMFQYEYYVDDGYTGRNFVEVR